GSDSNKQGFIHRIFRKNFVLQVAIPIALRYLNHAIENKPDENIDFNTMFAEGKPNEQLVNYFNEQFKPLKLENIIWKLSTARVNSIVEKTFDPILKQLSAIMSAYGVDFVLLAGRPTTIPKIREMFVKYYPVSPERIISLNNYRVGRWYPFADDIGYFSDPKTIVSVGAVIALMGGNIDKLDGFRLNNDLLKKKLISTSDYIGLLNPHTQNIDEMYVTPDLNSYEIEIHTLPMVLGYKQLPNNSYRARPIYKLEFNEAYFREKALEQNPNLKTEKEITMGIENYRSNFKTRMPFKVKIKREWANSREVLFVDGVRDANKNESSKQILNLSFMTLPNEKGYWLDTGEFVLNIK
ncbi:MAG TPA: virulence factor SrfB, partial [Ferruginibacter sp.]|nr:virulence factor SrfB [Ferruginibacter sp.]